MAATLYARLCHVELFDGAKAQKTRLCSESGRIFGKLSKAMPGGSE
jgi:hypothetical protein